MAVYVYEMSSHVTGGVKIINKRQHNGLRLVRFVICEKGELCYKRENYVVRKESGVIGRWLCRA